MNILSDWRVTETLREDYKTGIYRGVRSIENGATQSVILKTLRATYPLPEDVAQLRHEFEIARSLDIPSILKPLALVSFHNGVALVLEDFGGVSLHDFLRSHDLDQGLDLDLFFFIALEMCDALEQLHAQHIIHKDVKPGNILINPTTRQIKLGDFGIASQLSSENLKPTIPGRMQGTLLYMSPEQTGRMNRPLDYRTDFYSLGATFFEMLTGRVPFEANDAMEIVHAHLAKAPPAPQQLRHSLPPVLGEIVLKLLAKTASERYQSARGLKADLETCRAQWEAKRSIEPFPLGRSDFSGTLNISSRLYGREGEAALLLEAFEHASAGGRELMLVSGYSGIGKTSLIHELDRQMARGHNFFVAGKFDQLRRDAPYTSIIQALRDLLRQVLTLGEAELAGFKTSLLEVLGANGALLIEVLPELELVIGPQPPASTLGPQEAANRFNTLLGQFVGVWARPQHPLVLFLDDLQWADAASLHFLQSLVTDAARHHLLVIGAYRDNEVLSSHPLMLALDEIRKGGVAPCNIVLGSLAASHIAELLQDTLSCPPAEAAPLAELLLQRTEGNPFFLSQLLKSLHERQLLRYEDGHWRWNLAAISEANLTGNVVELMASKIQALPPATRDALKLAACIGNRFDSTILALVREQSAAQVGTDLWEALRAGLIAPLSGAYQTLHLPSEATPDETSVEEVVTYKFLHDRVQQAAYSLLSEAERAHVHLRMGRLLLEHTRESERDKSLFDIVGHWNQARELVTDEAELRALMRLNFEAGLKAKASAAHAAALNFFALAQNLAALHAWNEDDTLFRLVRERSECEYLEGHFEAAETQFAIALTLARSPLDKAEVETIRVQLYITRNDYEKAVAVGLDGLAALGLRLPLQPSQATVLRVLIAVKTRKGRRSVSEIFDVPRLSDARRLAQLKLLEVLGPAFFLCGNQNLFVLANLHAVQISLRHGNAPESCTAYAGYGVILGLALSDYQGGLEFGEMAVRLAQRFESPDRLCTTTFVLASTLLCWRRPLRESWPLTKESYRLGIETGNTIYAGYSISNMVAYLSLCGLGLDELDAEIEKYLPFFEETKDYDQRLVTTVTRQIGRNLQGQTRERSSLGSDDFDEEAVITAMQNGTSSGTSQFWYHLSKARLCYLWGNYQGALDHCIGTERVLTAMPGTAHVPEHVFFHSLTLAALYRQAPASQQKSYWKKLGKNQKQMQRWAQNSPANFEHKWLLVAGEMARIEGKHAEATVFYDRAISAAHDAAYLQNEALANEIAARCFQSDNRSRLTATYAETARVLYGAWGASAKSEALVEEFGLFVPMPAEANRSRPLDARTTSTITTDTLDGEGTSLDFATVIKAAQALSGEIDLRSLLQKLLRFALENAGATRGALIFQRDSRLWVEAVGSVSEDEVVLPSSPLDAARHDLPLPLLQYVARTRESLVIGDTSSQGLFSGDASLLARGAKSVLCAPIMQQNRFIGLVYLENHLALEAFTPDRLEVLNVLCSQAAISLQNAQLYGQLEEYNHTLEQRVAQRTDELNSKNEQLEKTLADLQAMQDRVIVQEKMASLGALTAGIAHEIKNPLNFVNNFAVLSIDLTEELGEELGKLGATFDDATREYVEEILTDLKGNAQRINEHGKRADSIVRNMLLHSRSGVGAPELTDFNALVREAAQLSYHGQSAKELGLNIVLDEHYDEAIGRIKLSPQEISRVVLNLVNNACYAAHQKSVRLGVGFSPQVRVMTQNGEKTVEIRVEDNGDGIPEAARSKLFTPFYTTKPTGEGTGLGLSMSYDIVVQGHGGELTVQSTPGEFTQFKVVLPKR